MGTQAPPEVAESLRLSGPRRGTVDFAGRAPQVGDHAPDFVLPDRPGFRALSDVASKVINRYGLKYDVDPRPAVAIPDAVRELLQARATAS